MPTAVASAVFSAAAFSAGTTLTTALVLSNLAYYATTAVISFGLSALSGALTKGNKPKGAQSFSQALADRTLTTRQAISPRRIIYGNPRVGGIYTFIETSGAKNKYLNLVITLSGHRIDAVEKLYFDGEEVGTYYAPTWASGSYSDGDVVYYDGAYYTRTSTPYNTVPAPEKDTGPGTNSLWQSYSFDASTPPFAGKWVSGQSYNQGDVVYIISSGDVGSASYYQRTAVAYATKEVLSDTPDSDPTLWTETTGYVSDRLYPADGSLYDGYLKLQYNLGSDDQTAFSELVEELPDSWTSDHRQAGCAGVYLRLKYNNDVYPNGIPAISFKVRGKNDIYDPRDGQFKYTNNAALCTADYLALDNIGIGAQYGTEILEADLIEAANICDEQVDVIGGGTEARYSCDGTLDTSDTPYKNLQSLVSAMAGAVISPGKFWIVRAGAYRSPEISAITDGDIVDSITQETLTSKKDLFNGVKGVFSAPENDYQPDDFPAVQVASYVAEDNGEEIWKEVELNLTQSASAAQRISRNLLELNRRQETISFTCMTRLYQLQVYDTVPVTLERYGWDNKLFRVENIELILDEAWKVKLDLKAIDANAFSWSVDDESVYTPAPKTNLPSAFSVVPPGLTLSEEVVSTFSSAATNLIANLVSPDDDFVLTYETQFRAVGDTEWIALQTSQALVHKTSNIVDGTIYEVRARSVNAFGNRSDWSDVKTIDIVGQIPVPQDVDGFSVNIVGSVANLSWSAVEDADLSHYVIKHSPLTTGANWATANVLVDRVGRPATTTSVPALVGTYLIKAVDFIGGESENPTIITSDVSGLETQNLIITNTQSPSFAGAKDDVVLSDSGIQLEYTDDVFGRGDFFAVEDFFLGLNGIASSGYYTFDAPIDLGDIYTSRVRIDLEAFGLSLNSDLFARADFFAVEDFFSTQQSQWLIRPEIRITQDDPSGSPTWTDWQRFIVGDYTARAIDLRIQLITREQPVTPVVTDLSATITIPDENRAGDDLVAPVSGLTVSFSPAFNTLKGIGIAAQDLATGDRYVITNKDQNGFDIQFFDSVGTAISRTFDYVAVGYGKKEV